MKKAQSSILEIVFVLVFITVMLVTVFGMVSTVSTADSQIGSDEELSRTTVQLARNMMSLPFVTCNEGITDTRFCLDLYRTMSVINVQEQQRRLEDSLFPIFGSTQIRAWHISNPEEPIILYNASPRDYTLRRSKSYPITIYDAVQETHTFGMIEVRVYR